MRPHPAAGFTLAELGAVVAIVGIVAAIASAVVNGAVHAAHAADARTALLDTYQSAIRHAASRGVHVVVCPSDGSARCSDGIDWTGGWFAFEDRDGDRDSDPGERVVGTWSPLGNRVKLLSTVGRKRLVFQPSGGNAGSNVTFTLCDGRGFEHAVQLVIANNGRLRELAAPRAVAVSC